MLQISRCHKLCRMVRSRLALEKSRFNICVNGASMFLPKFNTVQLAEAVEGLLAK